MEGFALRDAGDDGHAPLALRPIHLALVAFVATLLAHAPTIGAFAEAPQFEAIADTFLFALLLAAVTSSVVVLLRGLQRPRKVFARARVTAIAAAAYLLGTMGAVGLLFAPMPLPAAAVGAGLLAGAALPLLVAEWARAVAVPIDQALVLCAFVVLTASFVGWILALLPPSALVPVFCLLLVAGVVVPPVAARMGDPALPLARPADTMRRLVSVTWLPLLGFAVYAFMTDVMAHSAFGVVQASFLGGSGCGAREPQEPVETTPSQTAAFTRESKIEDVKNAPIFGSYGRLLFPVEDAYYSGDTLEELQLTYYSHIDPDETVEIVNTLRERAADGQTIFYDIYTDEEKAADPAKEDTGLFFFKGIPGEKFAICNAGGAFAYVGAMQDSFPHALELSQKGYNAFALIYRPGAQTACEDLARAIRFIFDHADELEVDTDCYSLWGGSAGARMAAWLGSYGAEAFGGGDLPRPGAVIMQYTGLSEYFESDPPTYACVGDRDGIANWRVMQARLEAMQQAGIDTEFHVYSGLGHGFGLGTGTSAEGWINDAVSFWEQQMKK